MRRFTVMMAAAAVLGATLALPRAGFATSVGIYGTVGGGGADWEDTGRRDSAASHDTRHTGAGIVLDASSPVSPLGYRLAVGWERIVNEPEAGGPGFTLRGVVVDQDLTLNVLVAPGPLRVWAGPELRLAFLKGTPDGDPGTDENFFAIGIGPVLGVDFAVSPGLAVSWKVGYLVTGYSGDERSSADGRYDTSVGEGHAYAGVALLFRTWGGYPERPPDYAPPERHQRRW